MADIVDTQVRSRIMAKVPRFNTAPEVALRRALHALGFRFRLHRSDLPGRPDLILPRYHAAVFVHGCFWHRHQECSRATTPQSNALFWKEKFGRNQERDARVKEALPQANWRVAFIWECAIRRCAGTSAKAVAQWLQSTATEFEFPPRPGSDESGE